MTNEHNDEDNIAILRAKLYEKTRIEEYLRAEVKELWKVINSTHASKVYKTYLLLTKFQNTLKRVFDLKFPSFFNTLKTINNESVKEMSASKTYFFDFVFVIPSNKIEIGGLKSAFNLAKFLFKKGFLVKIIYLNHDPTGSVEDFLSHFN